MDWLDFTRCFFRLSLGTSLNCIEADLKSASKKKHALHIVQSFEMIR